MFISVCCGFVEITENGLWSITNATIYAESDFQTKLPEETFWAIPGKEPEKKSCRLKHTI